MYCNIQCEDEGHNELKAALAKEMLQPPEA